MMFLSGIYQTKDFFDNTFPFNLPVFKNLQELNFSKPITIIVGKNGSGKSSLLELLAMKAELQTIGRKNIEEEPSLAQMLEILPHYRLSWAKKTQRGFFFRAEDFFNFAEKIEEMKAELTEISDELATELTGEAKDRVLGTVNAQKQALRERYGRSGLNAMSHGEAFFQFCKERIVPGGLYLLDEPETPFSPQMQLALMGLIKQSTDKGSQVIMVTHSPLLMATPNAEVLQITKSGIQPIDYQEIEHVQITKAFLNNPAVFLKEYFSEKTN